VEIASGPHPALPLVPNVFTISLIIISIIIIIIIIMASDKALQTPFTFSFMRRGKGVNSAAAAATATTGDPKAEATAAAAATQQPAHPYETAIKTIATVDTVENFWEIYNWLKRPADLPTSATTDYHFFRSGIKPTWEDPSNAAGGKWIVRLPKGLSSRYWEEICLALIGGQLQAVPDGEVCGAVLSVRMSEDILGIWNKTANDREIVERLRDAIRRCLQLPAQANLEYKPHQNSLQDRSSFRNTQVWKPKSLEGRSTSMGEPSTTASTGTPATSGSGNGSSGGGGGGAPPGRSRQSAWEERKTRRGNGAESSSSRWRS